MPKQNQPTDRYTSPVPSKCPSTPPSVGHKRKFSDINYDLSGLEPLQLIETYGDNSNSNNVSVFSTSGSDIDDIDSNYDDCTINDNNIDFDDIDSDFNFLDISFDSDFDKIGNGADELQEFLEVFFRA